MGATTFYNTILVKGDARTAYRELREEMRDENGHQQGYSGDIQTCSGFKLYTDAPRYGTKAFDKWEDKMVMNKLDKWGDAACVEIKGTIFKRMKERRGLKGRKGYRAFYFFGWGAC